MRLRHIVKFFFLATSGLLIAFGIFLLIFSWFFFRELKQWHKTHPFDIKVDLSQPGEFSEQFTLKCPYAFSYDLWLILPHSLSVDPELMELFAGLEARYSVIDYSGSEIEWLRELPLEPLTKPSEGQVLLETIGLLHENTYTFKLTVSHGAGALSGVEQRLVMDYNIGFAAALPLLALALGMPSFAFGVILAFLIVKLTRKKSEDKRQQL